MNQADPPVKPQITEQTFIDLCTWLSDDKAHSEDQLDRLKDEEHYLNIIELANTYWLIGHLAKQLKKSNIWRQLPAQLQDYLTKFEALYFERSKSIQQEALSVCRLLSEVTSQQIVLKGGASLFNGVSNPISTRYMADIDILVPEDKLEDCLSILLANGYKLDVTDTSISTSDFHHAPPLIRENGPCYIELHRRPLINSLVSLMDAEEAFHSAISLPLTSDLAVQQMHPTQQIIHSIAHSELQDLGFEETHIDLRQLLNFYLLAKTFAAQISWPTVEQRYADTDLQEILQAICFHANKLFGLPIYISNLESDKAQMQYQLCIQNFTQSDDSPTKLSSIGLILQGYSKATITNLYGEKGYFPVFRGRLKHLKRHVLMFFKGKGAE